jgi:hypothetical protein
MTDLRCPVRLSPSGLACWEKNPDEAFYRYIVPKELRPEKEPQTGPMSVGSAFDALVKAYLFKAIYGESKAYVSGYSISNLVSKQCEEHTLPESLVIACDCFEQYRETGALLDLLQFMRQSKVDPRMEFDVVKEVGGVPLLGKPDNHFHTIAGAHVIVDWKVSGSVSDRGVSPQQGFQLSRDIRGTATSGKAHAKYMPHQIGGVEVSGVPMNETTDYWADQLSTYAWCLGEPVGSEDFIVQIEQLACRPCPASDDSGRLRVKCCTHRTFVSASHQQELLARYQNCWEHLTTGHYFPHMTRRESDARADLLMRQLTNPAINPSSMSIGTIPTIDWS